jgi:hypothetical protein
MELDKLVETELQAATARTAAMVQQLIGRATIDSLEMNSPTQLKG